MKTHYRKRCYRSGWSVPVTLRAVADIMLIFSWYKNFCQCNSTVTIQLSRTELDNIEVSFTASRLLITFQPPVSITILQMPAWDLSLGFLGMEQLDQQCRYQVTTYPTYWNLYITLTETNSVCPNQTQQVYPRIPPIVVLPMHLHRVVNPWPCSLPTLPILPIRLTYQWDFGDGYVPGDQPNLHPILIWHYRSL